MLIKDLTENMSFKQHADIRRMLKADIVRLKAMRDKATETLGDAQRELKAHEEKHPHYADKKAKKDEKAGPHFEPGRDADRTPSGGMGGR